MSTYLLTWNPSKGTGKGLAKLAKRMKHGMEGETWDWSTGNSKRIRKGDRIFFLRQGKEPRGICGSGWVTKGWYTRPHWEQGKARQANYVNFKFDVLIDPEIDPILPLDQLRNRPRLKRLQWRFRASGIGVPEDAAEVLEQLWERCGRVRRRHL